MKFQNRNTVVLRLQNQIILAILKKKNGEQIFTTLSFCEIVTFILTLI